MSTLREVICWNSDDVDDLVVDGELCAENKLFLTGLVFVSENS